MTAGEHGVNGAADGTTQYESGSPTEGAGSRYWLTWCLCGQEFRSGSSAAEAATLRYDHIIAQPE